MKNQLFLLAFVFFTKMLIAQVPELTNNVGHGSTILSADFSPDQRFIISSSWDNSIKLWDAKLGKELRTFIGHTDAVTSVCFSPNGRYIVSGSLDKTVKIWDIISGKVIKSFLAGERVQSVAYFPDGKYIASANTFNIIIWEINSGDRISTLKSDGVFTILSISPDGNLIACGIDKLIKVWDANNGNLLNTFSGHRDDVQSVSFSLDGKVIVSASWDKTLKLWDVTSGKNINTYKGHTEFVNTANISPDMKCLISGSTDYSIKLWDVTTKKVLHSFDNLKGVSSVMFSPDGKNIMGVLFGEIKLWDKETFREVKSLSGNSYGVEDARFSPDGKSIIVTNGNSIILWDIFSAKEKRIFAMDRYRCSSICFSPDGKYLASGGWDDTLRLWDINTGEMVKYFAGHKNDIISVCFTPDGKSLLTGSWDKTIIYWDISTGEKKKIISDFQDEVTSICVSTDGNYIAGASVDKTVKVWNSNFDKKILTISQQYYTIQTLCFSPDGKYLAGGSRDNSILLWDISSGKEVRKFGISFSETSVPDSILKDVSKYGHINSVKSIQFSSDGKYLLSGGDDGRVILWDVELGKILNVYSGQISSIRAVQFSPDGKYLLSGSKDCSVRLWDIKTGNWVAFVGGKEANKELVYTPDNYWDGTPSCGELVSMVKGLECWNIDQFAVKNNRPDIILKRLGSNDNELIKHYYAQYKKRLRKMDLSEEQVTADYYIPEAKITEAIQNNKLLNLKFSLSDSKYNLKRYNIFINDVPLFGSYGKEASGNSADLSETINLTSGDNKIEVSCMNEKGAESYRALTYISYSGETKRDLYFLAFGVSKYQNPAYNLQYADKDAKDLSRVIESLKDKGFDSVYTKVLTNEQVTPDAIKTAKTFVKDAKPDDTFILFIAGHGMHDKDADATYYYLTSNADINNLKATAADFETIEDLLQGIPPRNKLFLMDACESGEIDEEEQGQMIATATGAGIASRGFKKSTTEPVGVAASSTSTSSVASKRPYLYQKDRYIYNDLVRRSGAIVFSSSKGGELSYERSDIENGLFTEAIIKALTTTEADKDGNGVVSTDELRDFVTGEVAKASGDLQHPTVDRDNIYQKFGFIVK